MSDSNTILKAEEANRTDFHWTVGFTVKLDPSALASIREGEPCEHCGEEHDPDDPDVTTIAETVTVGCGDDGQVAIDRVKVHVYDEEKFGVKVVPGSFRLQTLKLVSVREL